MGAKLERDPVVAIGWQLVRALQDLPQLDVAINVHPNVMIRVSVITQALDFTILPVFLNRLKDITQDVVMALAQHNREAEIHEAVCRLLRHDPQSTAFDGYTVVNLRQGDGSFQPVPKAWPELLGTYAERLIRA